MDKHSLFPSNYIKNIVLLTDYTMSNNVLLFAKQAHTHTIRKGRFLVTTCYNVKKQQHKQDILNNEQLTIVKIGRFVVTTHYMVVKQEQPKPKQPTVERKGRFVVITTYH